MSYRSNITSRLDWPVLVLFLVLALLGWANIYAVEYDVESVKGIFNGSMKSSKQFIYICISIGLIVAVLALDSNFFQKLAWVFYGIFMFLMVLVLVPGVGREVAGSQSWFGVGGFGIQPSEFAKFGVALAVAAYLGKPGRKFTNLRSQLVCFGLVAVPAVLTLVQGDTGTAMVYAAFLVPFYREGLNPVIIVMGFAAVLLFVLTLFVPQLYLYLGVGAVALLLIGAGKKNWKRVTLILVGGVLVSGVVYSVDFVVTDVLKPHQQNRVRALINPAADPLGYGWNVSQSKIAIGAGGLWGQGYLEGTQTKLDYVPEQSTDFIFCTIGEEHGWVGSLVLIGLFVALIWRLIAMAERQLDSFARIFIYSAVGIVFWHFLVNIGMTIGLFPVVGIPLPFFSYGGSALLTFTLLLATSLKLDAHRMQVLAR